MSTRRTVTSLLGAILFAALVPRPASAKDLQFGITPIFSQTTKNTLFEPLMTYLSGVLGQKVGLFVAKDYDDLRIQMWSQAVDIGYLPPFEYVEAARAGKVRIVAQVQIHGTANYRGIIIARQDSGLKTLADLRGKRFAYVDRKSASGYVYPRSMLVDQGADPDHYFLSTLFLGDHAAVVNAVLNGAADAGAVYDGEIDRAKGQGVAVGDLVIIGHTSPIPREAIAVRTGLDPALVQQIQAALVNISNAEAARAMISSNDEGLTGFVVGHDKDFNGLRLQYEY